MAPYLSSGRRRDICVLLYGTDGLRGQQLKTDLEAHYDTRLDPGTFYSTLEALIDSGHLESQTDGLHDVYRLSDGGEAALEAHREWLSEEMDATADS